MSKAHVHSGQVHLADPEAFAPAEKKAQNENRHPLRIHNNEEAITSW